MDGIVLFLTLLPFVIATRMVQPIEWIFGWKLILPGGGWFSPDYPSKLGLVILLIIFFLVFVVIKILRRVPRQPKVFYATIIFFGIIFLYGAIALSASAPATCKLVFNGEGRRNRDICYHDIVKYGKSKGDIKICDAISSDTSFDITGGTSVYLKADCYSVIAVEKADASVCNNIDLAWNIYGSDLKGECLGYVTQSSVEANKKDIASNSTNYEDDYLSFTVPSGISAVKIPRGKEDHCGIIRIISEAHFSNIGELQLCYDFGIPTESISLGEKKLGQYLYIIQQGIDGNIIYGTTFKNSISQNFSLVFYLKEASGFNQKQAEDLLSSLKIK